ncbi:MAG: hypothetical protein ACI8VW_000488 [bacterium]|jgi:hypothetical protein
MVNTNNLGTDRTALNVHENKALHVRIVPIKMRGPAPYFAAVSPELYKRHLVNERK